MPMWAFNIQIQGDNTPNAPNQDMHCFCNIFGKITLWSKIIITSLALLYLNDSYWHLYILISPPPSLENCLHPILYCYVIHSNIIVDSLSNRLLHSWTNILGWNTNITILRYLLLILQHYFLLSDFSCYSCSARAFTNTRTKSRLTAKPQTRDEH